MLESVLKAYNLDIHLIPASQFGTGLINNTWKIGQGNKEYILQRINQSVFKHPEDIVHNLEVIGNYLLKHQPTYLFVGPIASKDGHKIVTTKDGIFRLFPFINGSHSKEVAETPCEAYEAAVQFGRFTKLLANININDLKVTLPNFHNLTYRYQQFLQALQTGNPQRIEVSQTWIAYLVQQAYIVDKYEQITNDASFKVRVMHHDTKISNMLFDAKNKGMCVIDLDTVMPGYFFSDVGDMMRTYLSAVTEEESDLSKITIRDDFYRAIVDGYRSEMKEELTETENEHFFYAAKMMIYMQALRFLTDHINDDLYYGAKYEGHNLIRAQNQITLLQRLLEKKTWLAHQ